jgi:hypothetical protein
VTPPLLHLVLLIYSLYVLRKVISALTGFSVRLTADAGVILGRFRTCSAIVRLACDVKYQTEFRHCSEKIFVRHSAIGRVWRNRSTLDISPKLADVAQHGGKITTISTQIKKKTHFVLMRKDRVWKETELLRRRILQSFQRFFSPPASPQAFPSLHTHTNTHTHTKSF